MIATPLRDEQAIVTIKAYGKNRRWLSEKYLLMSHQTGFTRLSAGYLVPLVSQVGGLVSKP
jgi:hypothetical protein